jgi:hypothetical protein
MHGSYIYSDMYDGLYIGYFWITNDNLHFSRFMVWTNIRYLDGVCEEKEFTQKGLKHALLYFAINTSLLIETLERRRKYGRLC